MPMQSEMDMNTYHVASNNLAVGLLGLPKARQEVPEAGLCDNVVGSKDAHAVELGSRVGLGRQEPTDDLVFLEATLKMLASCLESLCCRPLSIKWWIPPVRPLSAMSSKGTLLLTAFASQFARSMQQPYR